MAPHEPRATAALSSHYLRETAGFFADPAHGHSFARVHVASLTAIDRSMLFFRDCALCEQRVLWIGRQTRVRRWLQKHNSSSNAGSTKGGVNTVVVAAGSSNHNNTADGVCQCLQCGRYIHRDCLSFVHLLRRCLSRQDNDASGLLEPCSPTTTENEPQPRSSSSAYKLPSLFPSAKRPVVMNNSASKTGTQQQQPPRLFGNEHLPASFTLSTLIEELSRDPSMPAPLPANNTDSKPKSASTKSAKIARRVAPFLAAGGVLGAIALGPIGGMLAGLNVLVASVGIEAIAAGVGLTAATAAAATVNHKKKVRNAKRKLERLKSGEWAMEICWSCKKAFQGVPSDDAFRKDAEFLRRFQALPAAVSNGYGDDASGQQLMPGIPDADEVYAFLFGLLSSPSEFLSQVNVQLCAAFRERHNTRQKEFAAATKSSAQKQAATGATSTMRMRDTLQDTKMYVAHIMGATMQSFPSLASTDQALANCSQAIERIVYDDIYAIVFREFEVAFADADAIFHENIDRIRNEQRDRPVSLLYRKAPGGAGEQAVLHEDLQLAEQKLVEMVHSTCSPLKKLELLCTAFRAICCFADQLHQTASNADILIPIVCSLLISSHRLWCEPNSSTYSNNQAATSRSKRTFVSEIAFISFFTNGGGKGVEGYVLTTFQAVVQVIAAVDLSNGPAKELELFMDEDDQDTEDEEFFDAVSGN
ncbi:Vacuolar sorting protein 9 [Globisporangium polare]